ncbi:5182_t:CDS:10, partial [Scutellospora calospora]
ERILPIVNNIFAALLLNNIASEDECYTMILNFAHLSFDAMNRENSIIPEIVEAVDFTFAKVHFLQMILININDIPISLQTKLLPNPLLTKDSKQTFCILKTFFDVLENYPECNLLTPMVMSIDRNVYPLQNVSFVFEYRMLESLLLSRSFILCTLIIDCWGCVGKVLDSHVLYQEAMLILEIIIGLVCTPSTRYRLRRLFKRLFAFLNVEQQLKLSKFALSYTLQTSENITQTLSTTVYANDVENNSVNCMKLYTLINSYLEKNSIHSVDDLFSTASYLLVLQSKNSIPWCIKDEGDVKYVLFNIALTILKNSINCIGSLSDFCPSSIEFRKIFVTIDGVLRFMINLEPLTLAEILEVLKTVDHWTSLNNCICHITLCKFIDKFTEILLETNDKQIITVIDSIYEKILIRTRWFTKHEVIAQIAGYTQHSRNIEIIQPVIIQQLHEPVMRFINRIPSHFGDESISEINFWRFVEGRNEQHFRVMQLEDLFNKNFISTTKKILSNSIKINYDINDSTLECLKGAHLVNGFIQNYLAEHHSEVSSELKLVFNDLKDNLITFFQ